MNTVIQFLCGLNDGGAETLIKDYCILSDKSKLNVFPVAIYPNVNACANEKLILEHGINIVNLYSKYSVLSRTVNKLCPWYTSLKLKKILKKYRPVAIHVHMLCLRYLVPISKFLSDNNIKIFYTCHNDPKFMMDNHAIEYKSCKKLLLTNNVQLIALHDNMAKEMNKMFGLDNTIVINNGIDFSRYNINYQSKEEIKNNLGIPIDSFLIGHVGRFSEEKNHKFILEVFKKCLERNANSYLLLIGNGPKKEEIVSLSKKMSLFEHICFLSHRTDIPTLLHCMDCFIFPSLYEGLGMAAIEAQRAGLKVVMSDTIPSETHLTNNVIVKSLNNSVDEWADSVLYEKGKCEIKGNFNDYDMRYIIKNLEMYYMNEK